MKECRKCDFTCFSEYVMQLHYETAHVIYGELKSDDNDVSKMQQTAEPIGKRDAGNGSDLRGQEGGAIDR